MPAPFGFSRAVAGGTAAIMLALLPAPALAQRTVRCESRDYRYRYCRVDTHYSVRLVRQRSSTHCRQGRNWGYDRRGIWVDRGCAADFEVGDAYYGGDWGRDDDRGMSTGTKVAIGVGAVAAGAAIAAAIAANRDKGDSKVPSWAIGTFRGFDATEDMTVEVTILPGGSVSGTAGGNEFTGSMDDKTLQAGRHTFKVEHKGNGFLATDEKDRSHQVLFSLVGSGTTRGGY